MQRDGLITAALLGLDFSGCVELAALRPAVYSPKSDRVARLCGHACRILSAASFAAFLRACEKDPTVGPIVKQLRAVLPASGCLLFLLIPPGTCSMSGESR
jgi:hypothetical protein